MKLSRKLLYVLILLSISIPALAQRSESSVCGIKMGTDKKEALSILRDRFGYGAVSEDAGNIEVYEGSVGGISYKFMTFFFAWVNGVSKFNGALFSTPYELSEQKLAIQHRELIKSLYEGKYAIVEQKNDDGFKEYIFGDSISSLGLIEVIKSQGNDGKTRLYTQVIYWGPYSNTDDI